MNSFFTYKFHAKYCIILDLKRLVYELPRIQQLLLIKGLILLTTSEVVTVNDSLVRFALSVVMWGSKTRKPTKNHFMERNIHNYVSVTFSPFFELLFHVRNNVYFDVFLNI